MQQETSKMWGRTRRSPSRRRAKGGRTQGHGVYPFPCSGDDLRKISPVPLLSKYWHPFHLHSDNASFFLYSLSFPLYISLANHPIPLAPGVPSIGRKKQKKEHCTRTAHARTSSPCCALATPRAHSLNTSFSQGPSPTTATNHRCRDISVAAQPPTYALHSVFHTNHSAADGRRRPHSRFLLGFTTTATNCDVQILAGRQRSITIE